MRVTLDGRVIEGAPETVRGALATLAGEARRRGRLVIEVRADGQVLGGAALADPPEAPCSELEAWSADAGDLAREVLLDAAAALDSIRARQAAAAEHILTGRIDEVPVPLGEALNAWQMVHEAMLRVQELQADGLPVPVVDAGDLAARLAEHLSRVKRALTAGDWSALGDLLGYELESLAVAWKEVLQRACEARV